MPEHFFKQSRTYRKPVRLKDLQYTETRNTEYFIANIEKTFSEQQPEKKPEYFSLQKQEDCHSRHATLALLHCSKTSTLTCHSSLGKLGQRVSTTA